MENIQKIKAYLHLDGQKLEIGDMAQSQNRIYFKYNTDFIAKDLEISSFKMKVTNEIISPKETHFDGLFGVFSDSIPDGWGRLLLDRKLILQGINPSGISILNRLAFIGYNSMGAISYEPEYKNEFDIEKNIDLDKTANEIEKVLQGSEQQVLEELFQLGGSSGGARPKILVGFNDESGELIYGNSDLPEGFEHWIIKFPCSTDLPEIGLIEYLYNEMAKNAGIEVSGFRLFQSKRGKRFFGSKPFDRIKNKKLHLHSVAGLLHDNFRRGTKLTLIIINNL